MREIKFRAWNARTCSMVLIDPQKGPWTNRDLVEDAEWKVMQFTGLHDRNGREIYGGDIAHDQFGQTKVVEWVDKEARFCYRATQPFAGITTLFFWDGAEHSRFIIIGNIYENPELLEAK